MMPPHPHRGQGEARAELGLQSTEPQAGAWSGAEQKSAAEQSPAAGGAARGT